MQLQLSPGSRMAAAGFSSQRMEPSSGLGRLCHGSMHTNFALSPRHRPNQRVGELRNVAYHGAAGAFLVNPQLVGSEVHHAVAVVGEQLPGDGKGADVAAQGVEIPVNQPQRLTAQADGRLRLAEPKLVVRQRMLVVKGNGEGGMVPNAKVQLVGVPVFHRQLVVQGVARPA